MAYQSFEYTDLFKDSVKAKLPEALRVTGGTSDPGVLLIIRLLSGTLAIEHSYSGVTVRQKNNYFVSDLKNFSSKWRTKFPLLISEDYTIDDLASYVVSTRTKNVRFFRNILTELSYYALYEKKGAHMSAFIFLYRTLEKISYAFPLVYAARADDFHHTYSFLKELMEGKNSGELGFFRAFATTIYKDDPLASTSVEFHIGPGVPEEQELLFTVLRALCPDDIIAPETVKPRVLAINYLDVGSFIITLRNRFFHYMSQKNNIDSANVIDPDLMFSSVNSQCLYWIATIFLGILSHSIDSYEIAST